MLQEILVRGSFISLRQKVGHLFGFLRERPGNMVTAGVGGVREGDLRAPVYLRLETATARGQRADRGRTAY